LITNAELHEYLAVSGAKMRLSQLMGYDTRRTFISGQWNNFVHDWGSSSGMSRTALCIVWWDCESLL